MEAIVLNPNLIELIYLAIRRRKKIKKEPRFVLASLFQYYTSIHKHSMMYCWSSISLERVVVWFPLSPLAVKFTAHSYRGSSNLLFFFSWAVKTLQPMNIVFITVRCISFRTSFIFHAADRGYECECSI